MAVEIQLPLPWSKGQTFTFEEMRPLTWLVGPNGSGKSRFLKAIRDVPELSAENPRLLSTDRLAGSRNDETTEHLWASRVKKGLRLDQFEQLLAANHRGGALVGSLALLHKRSDLRVRIEATLSSLLNRQLRLTLANGFLVSKIRHGASEYEMHSDECHGVLELVCLLANIYDNETKLLLVDEPELNLHPQYQAFLIEEIRQAGKRVVLATHSPSILDVKTMEDLAARGGSRRAASRRDRRRWRGDETKL